MKQVQAASAFLKAHPQLLAPGTLESVNREENGLMRRCVTIRSSLFCREQANSSQNNNILMINVLYSSTISALKWLQIDETESYT